MTIRAAAVTLIGAGVLASAPAQIAQASAGGWRFVKAFPSLSACQGVGKVLVGHHQAREFRCENDYNKAGVPQLDLYVR